jgi:polysaccharide deacetylase family protein (PEP-CTERM system associated)
MLVETQRPVHKCTVRMNKSRNYTKLADRSQSSSCVTFTVDVENHRAGLAEPHRYRMMTRRLMDFLEQHGIRGTFFVVAELVLESPKLIAEIAERGHELACHGNQHTPLSRQTPGEFARSLLVAKQRLEACAGGPVSGFRAPFFSLTPATRWAVPILADTGFAYSSSVLPGRGFAYGYPGAPRGPFFWPEGVLEIPCPAVRLGPLALPILGGMYMRWLPPWDWAWMRQRLRHQLLWTYCHPYDIDTAEPFGRFPGLGWASSFMLWAGRGVTLRRWKKLAKQSAPPFRDRLAEIAAMARAGPCREAR